MTEQSDLEANLAFQLRRAQIKGWQRECRFHPHRRWRADFLFPSRDIIIEVQGGLWGGKGRHSRMEGYSNDARKSAEAQLLGYTVLYITPEMLNNTEGYKWSEAIDLIERALASSERREDGSGQPVRRVVGVEPQKGNWRDLMEEE